MIPIRSFPTGRPGVLALLTASLVLCAAAAWSQDAPRDAANPDCDEGMRLAADRQFEAARAALTDCLETNGDALAPMIALTAMALDQDRRAEALDWSTHLVTAFPDSVEAEYWYGRSLSVTGDIDGARGAWERGLELNREHGPTIRALANLLLSLGEERPAYGLLNHLILVEGPDAWTLKTLSNLARKTGLWRLALSHWDAALRLSAPVAADLRMAGELAILAGDTTYAMKSASDAVALEPSPPSLAVLGEALFAARRIGESIPVFERALELDGSFTSVRFHLANAYELVGRAEDAEVEFRRYTSQRPQDPAGFTNLAVHLDKRGRTIEALMQADQAILIAPDQPGPALLRAKLLDKMGEDDALVAALDDMLARGLGDTEQLTAWRDSVDDRLAAGIMHVGQVMLQHIVTPDSTAVRLIEEDILDGLDFTVIATRYSVGPTAAQGGDIGWVSPDDMEAELRPVIRALEVREVSRVVPADGLFHFFKRLR